MLQPFLWFPKMNNVSGTCKHFAGVFLVISWRKISALAEQKIPPERNVLRNERLLFEIKWNDKFACDILYESCEFFVINQYCGFLILHKVKKCS